MRPIPVKRKYISETGFNPFTAMTLQTLYTQREFQCSASLEDDNELQELLMEDRLNLNDFDGGYYVCTCMCRVRSIKGIPLQF